MHYALYILQCALSIISRIDFHHITFKILAVYCSRFQPIAVRINSIERIIEDLRDAGALLYAQPHKGQDTQIGIENFARGKVYTLVGPQEGVDLRHKVGIDMQEGIIEHIVEFATLFFDKFSRFRHAVQFIRLTGRKFSRRYLT